MITPKVFEIPKNKINNPIENEKFYDKEHSKDKK